MASEAHDRIGALEAEIRRLRESPVQTDEPPKPPKIEEVLRNLREAALVLKEGNDPALDSAMQNERRMVALANVTARLIECVMSGLGATGLFVQKLNEGLGGLYQEVGHLKQIVGVSKPSSPGPGDGDTGSTANGEGEGEGEGEEIEVDNGVPPGHVMQAPSPAAPAPIMATTPAGMPPEIARLTPPGQTTPIASVVVKPS